MKSISLYSQDRSLRSEAQLLISTKPDDVSRGEWRKNLKEFRSKLSPEDLREFERHRQRKQCATWQAENPEKAKASSSKWRTKNPKHHTKWRSENPEKARENSDRWKIKNPEKAREDARKANAKRRANNPNKARETDKKHYAKNSKKVQQRNTTWRTNNVEHVREHRRKYSNARRAEDPLYRLRNNMRKASRRIVKQLSLRKKPTNTFKWIGCSPEELKFHLESLFTKGMTWKNYGKWHVDHIRPICSFFPEEWEQVNHYTNLRPLWAEDNIAKSVFDRQLKRKKETH